MPDTDAARHDLEAAARAFEASRNRGTADASLDPFAAFLGQISFLLTIGYLTKEQGQALIDWFNSSGMMKLPPHPDPPGAPQPSMYEMLSTQVHFGTPQAVLDLQDAGATDGMELAADIGDFFSGLLGAVGDLVGTVLDGVEETLQAGTALLHAATELVHAIHDTIQEP